jgi:two-component system cell cycle response regulator DivK
MRNGESTRSDSKKILIVEDNELNRKLLTDVLEFRGYTIFGTELGAVALDLARQYGPELILMDIQLPDISGIEAARLLRADEQTRAIPIIAVSAFIESLGGSVSSGSFDAHVSKPVNLNEFLPMIDRYMTRHADTATPEGT